MFLLDHKVEVCKQTTLWGGIQVAIRLEVYVGDSPTYRYLDKEII